MKRIALLLLSLACALPAAAAERYVFDMSHTRVLFEISHLGYSLMPGMFHDYEIDFMFDPEVPENSTLNVTIAADSIDMFHGGLNDHLKNADFFDVANHPTLTFNSTRVEAIGEGVARVTGDMTLLGETHPVVFDVELLKHAPDPRSGAMKAGFVASGMLDRTTFGLDYAAPFVGTAVEFSISGEAAKEAM